MYLSEFEQEQLEVCDDKNAAGPEMEAIDVQENV